MVVPGQVIAQGMDFLPSQGTYRLGDTIRANRLGLIIADGKVLKSIPLAGKYLPKRNDIVIGKVIDILMSGWRVQLNCPYVAQLSLQDATFDYISKFADLTKYFGLEDYILAKIVNVTSQNLVDITLKGPGLKKLQGGRIIKLNPMKVPRVIGKKGSMVSMIKKATGCQIMVGQNGLIWISGEPKSEVIAFDTIKKIEESSHLHGLTDMIKNHLEEKTGVKLGEEGEQ